jgi:hypothetical protein
MKTALILSLLLLTSSCALQQTVSDDLKQEEPSGDYKDILDKWTNSDKSYSGLKADFIVDATLRSRELIEHQIYRDAIRLAWTGEQFRDARQKALFEASTQTQFFVSLYTEVDDINNLDKTSSSWNIFLDVGGKRISPKQIKRVFDERDVVITNYPYHTVWARPYIITFPVSTSELMGAPVTLTLAGPRGGIRLVYPRKD